jgi:hypothetical protein
MKRARPEDGDAQAARAAANLTANPHFRLE